MKYQFEQKHGQLREGYTVLTIIDGQAIVTNDDEKALAERYGGKPAVTKPKQESAKAPAAKPGGKD